MAVAVVMPKVGITVETCIIGAWLKKPGDTVAAGEALFSYETDKAAFECESTADGALLEVFYKDGDEVPVLAPVCAIGAPGEDVSGLRGGAGAASIEPRGQDEALAARDAGPGNVPAAETADAATPPAGGVRISPRARNLAKRLGLDYALATPSGPDGRIIERDIEALLKNAPAETLAKAGAAAAQAPETPEGRAGVGAAAAQEPSAPDNHADSSDYTDEKLPKIRRVISSMMSKSLSEMAQITHHHSFDASKILEMRAEFKKHGAQYGVDGVTLGDIVLFAVSRTLPQFPDFNAHLIGGDTMRRFKAVNLGVAMDTKRGLLVPTVFGADKKSLRQISSEVKQLAEAARSGAINPDMLSGGTFTVSNLGATGVEMFTPIINPPQTAILGVCGITARVREAPGGGIETYPAMGLSITYDHRAIDGAPASAFAQKLCKTLEHISLLLTA